ncbi:MAG: hypothetical protein R2713_00510 [Ilumatobacteraceae bacterium]
MAIAGASAEQAALLRLELLGRERAALYNIPSSRSRSSATEPPLAGRAPYPARRSATSSIWCAR